MCLFELRAKLYVVFGKDKSAEFFVKIITFLFFVEKNSVILPINLLNDFHTSAKNMHPKNKLFFWMFLYCFMSLYVFWFQFRYVMR